MTNHARRSSVVLDATAVARMTEIATNALPNETGGLLLGWINGHELRVTDAIAVSDPAATPSSYTRANSAGNSALAQYLSGRERGDPTGYVGEWHSHPAPAGPSAVDQLSFLNIARHVACPLAFVVLARHDAEWIPTVQSVVPKKSLWNRKART